LDDGPREFEEALDLARALWHSGVSRAVATPHRSSRYPTELETARAALRGLRRTLADAEVGLELSLSAEFSTGSAVSVAAEELAAWAMGGRYLLVEAEPATRMHSLLLVCERLGDLGLGLIVGHPERCEPVQRSPHVLDDLRRRGALIQVCAPSLLGLTGRPAMYTAWRLLELRGTLVASDAHDTARRQPLLRRAATLVARALGPRLAVEALRDLPARLLDGQAPGVGHRDPPQSRSR
jgi:protein-tyrosine phosphatase